MAGAMLMYTYRAKLVRVIDGDSVVLDIDLGFYITVRVPCRMAGIDTPERGQPNYNEARIELEGQIKRRETDGVFYVTTAKDDKYGRWLVRIGSTPLLIDDVSDAMVAGGFAVAYTGGKR